MTRFNQQRFKIILLLLLACCFLTCLDEIDIQPPSNAGKSLTVDGTIYSSPGPYSIVLTESAEFIGTDNIPLPILGASVKISDDAGSEEVLNEVQPGVYQTSENGMRGQIGRTYVLEIEVNGTTYRSQPETMQPIVSAENLEIEFTTETLINEVGNITERQVVNLLVSTPFAMPTSSFLKWNTFGIYEYSEQAGPGNLSADICYVTETIDLDNVAIASSEEVADGMLQKQKILTKVVDYRFSRRYCFNVVQQSITKSVYNFWETVESEFNRSGNIFEPPPGRFSTNVFNVDNPGEKVLGVFSVAAVDTIRLLVDRSEVENPEPQCRPFPRGPDSCRDCLLLSNSTHEKPPCWR